jgi:hypothetical protein
MVSLRKQVYFTVALVCIYLTDAYFHWSVTDRKHFLNEKQYVSHTGSPMYPEGRP